MCGCSVEGSSFGLSAFRWSVSISRVAPLLLGLCAGVGVICICSGEGKARGSSHWLLLMAITYARDSSRVWDVRLSETQGEARSAHAAAAAAVVATSGTLRCVSLGASAQPSRSGACSACVSPSPLRAHVRARWLLLLLLLLFFFFFFSGVEAEDDPAVAGGCTGLLFWSLLLSLSLEHHGCCFFFVFFGCGHRPASTCVAMQDALAHSCPCV